MEGLIIEGTRQGLGSEGAGFSHLANCSFFVVLHKSNIKALNLTKDVYLFLLKSGKLGERVLMRR